MSITSYAQNFEDVMLWRALCHVPNGFYIDIGAQHPIVDSVSKAFYENGWKGVHVEATPAYASLLRQDRPDETVIQAAVNDKPGIITFFEIPETGISTGDSDIAKSHKARGFNVLEITVPCITLLDVFKYADSKDIHWLKVDVEGMERKVLQSWGKSQVRPWIVIIESTLPLTQIENHQKWENLLLKRGYVHVYFDGLNRYYLLADQQQLASAFLSGPNVFDGFTLHGSASAPFCAAVNEKHRQVEQALQQRVALLNQENQEKADSLQHFDAALVEISAQLRASQEDEQKTKAAIAEDSLERAAQEREWQVEVAALHAQRRQADQESDQREQAVAVKLESASVKAMQESAELAHALAQERDALQNQHAEREQSLLNRLEVEQQQYRQLQHEASRQVDTLQAQSSQHQQKIENLLRIQLQREQAITDRLEAVRAQATQEIVALARTHAAQQSDLSRQYAGQEQALRQRLEAEQAHHLQLQKDNSAREQVLHEQIRSAQQATENFLQSQVERERDSATQLLALQQKLTQENTELSRALAKQLTELHSQHTSREQALHDQAHNAQQEGEKLLRVQMQREQAIAEKLDAVRAQAAQDNKELMRALAEQKTSLHNQHIAHEQARQEIEKLLQTQLLREQEISQHRAADKQLAAQEKLALQQAHEERLSKLSRQQEQHEAALTQDLHAHQQALHKLQANYRALEQKTTVRQAAIAQLHSEQLYALHAQLKDTENTLGQELFKHQEALRQQQLEQLNREAALIQKHEQARQQLQALQTAAVQRQQELTEQLQATKQQAEQYTADQLRQHVEQERVLHDQHAQRDATLTQQLEEHRQTLLRQQKDSIQLKQSLDNEIAALQNETQALRQTHQQAQQNELALKNKLEEHASLHSACATLETQLRAEVQSGQQTSLQLRQTLTEVQHSLGVIHASTSWRKTAQLRNLVRLFTRNKKQLPLPFKTSDAITSKPEIQVMAEQSSLTANHVIDQPIKPRLEQKKTISNMPTTVYTLPELLACNDQKFVQSAYWALLGREPDPEGMSYYLGRLRAGYSKMRIVAQLRISNEGKAHAANLPGLDAAVKRQERGQQPITGWLFRLFEGTDGERPTERRLRTIENQINILRGESVFGLNQIETLLRGVHHLVAQQAQYTPAATNDLNRSTNENTIIASEILSDFEIHEQLPPRARNIYFKIKRATVNNSRSLT